MLKKSKGITIVSLVVTIIVLVILAGVSITALIGENGIITLAKKAKENTTLAQETEMRELNELYAVMQKEGTTDDVSYDVIAKFIEYRKAVAEAISSKGVKTGKNDNIDIVVKNIKKIGNVKEKSEVEEYRDLGTYMQKNTTIKDSEGNLINIPEGFKIAEDSGINVTEGIVIEDDDIIEGIGINKR